MQTIDEEKLKQLNDDQLIKLLEEAYQSKKLKETTENRKLNQKQFKVSETKIIDGSTALIKSTFLIEFFKTLLKQY